MTSLNLEAIPPAESTPADGSGSALDRIRARFRKARDGQRLDLGFPDNREMAVRYRPIPDDRMDDLTAREGTIGIDYLIAACECILIRGESGDGWVPLTDDGVPVGYDERLADLLGLDVPAAPAGTARDVVLAVFATAPSAKLAAGRHVTRLTGWMSGWQVDEEEMLGES